MNLLKLHREAAKSAFYDRCQQSSAIVKATKKALKRKFKDAKINELVTRMAAKKT